MAGVVMGLETGGGGCRRGLKMRTTTSAKIMSKRRKMHFRLPVFFWYLLSAESKREIRL